MDENTTPGKDEQAGRPRTAGGREMLVQLQQMIDTIASQAAPVMREVAAKAAELAAVAGEKAGPIAHRAAGVTETVGQRVAARSKEVAADLRRPHEEEPAEGEAAAGAPPAEAAEPQTGYEEPHGES
jgi:hypothetical protein